MKAISLVVLLLSVSSSYTEAKNVTSVTPIQKVLQLLQGMKQKGVEEKKAEQVNFSAYSQFCEDNTNEKNRQIKEGNAKIEHYSATIKNCDATAQAAHNEVQDLAQQIAGLESDMSTAQAQRDEENKTYQATHADYSESVDALDRAIQVLKAQNYDRKQAGETALLQVQKIQSMNRISSQAQSHLLSFLKLAQAPEAHGYEFQSGGVVEMLEKLKGEFREERQALERDEMRSKHSFEMLKQDLHDQIDAANDDKERESGIKSKNMQESGEAKESLAQETNVRDSNVKFLRDLKTECNLKSEEFEKRQTLRQGELDAIDQAVEILSSGAVSGAGDKHLPSFMQLRRSSKNLSEDKHKQVASFLMEKAKKIKSNMLSQLAASVSVGTSEGDAFDKVKKMIKNMIVRLMEEANKEAEHKGWCNTELANNKLTREQKTSDRDQLFAEVEGLQAKIAKLSDDISNFNEQIADAQRALKEATENRNAENAENKVTIKEAKEAQQAVENALNVLKDFYAGAGNATALVQTSHKQPVTWDSSYQGMQSENKGVIGMLEVILSDFARLESETKTEETMNANSYTEFKNDTEVDVAKKTQTVFGLEHRRQRTQGKLQSAKRDLRTTQAELDAANTYYEKLKPSCVDSGLSYEERVAKREEEIESLQEALQILAP